MQLTADGWLRWRAGRKEARINKGEKRERNEIHQVAGETVPVAQILQKLKQPSELLQEFTLQHIKRLAWWGWGRGASRRMQLLSTH